MIQNLFVISASGEVLIEKHWRGKAKRTIAEVFLEEAGKFPNKSEIPPVIPTQKHFLINVYRFGLHFVSSVDTEVPPLLVLEAQHRIVDVLLYYFKNKVTESALRDNFSTVYQLLDEMIDGGYPSTTELDQLRAMITPPSFAQKLLDSVTGNFSVKTDVVANSRIPWRASGIDHVNNEVYFDIIEHLDAIIAPNEQLLNAEVYGEIRCTSRLSGMPDLTLTFNRPSLLDDCSLHRCIRINKYKAERILSFVPPDDKFKLLSYRVRNITQLPVWARPSIKYSTGGGKISIQVGTKYTHEHPVEGIALVFNLPAQTTTHSLVPNIGSVKLDQVTKEFRWEIGSIPKDKKPSLDGTVSFPADVRVDERPTIRFEYSVKAYAASGLAVDNLAIKGVKYKPFKGFRIVTKAGKIEMRC